MWYFSWILGIGVALGFGIINVMWLDANGKLMHDPDAPDATHTPNAQSPIATTATAANKPQ
jgi:cytochrome bd-I ubiquinol oxidase subunit X